VSFGEFVGNERLHLCSPFGATVSRPNRKSKPETERCCDAPILSQAMSERGNGPKLMDGWRDWRREIAGLRLAGVF
jgi:hypothetical protein